MDMGKIIGVLNQDGEVLEFSTPVKITEKIEQWLKRVDFSMKFNVARTIQLAFHSFANFEFLEWIKLWPTQFLLCVLEINLSRRLAKIFEDENQKNNNGRKFVTGNSFGIKQNIRRERVSAVGQTTTASQEFKAIYTELQMQITQLTLMIRDQLTNSIRMTVNTLIINRVHSRDIIRNMLNAGIDKSSDFLWNIHMRYEWVEKFLPTIEIHSKVPGKGKKPFPKRNSSKHVFTGKFNQDDTAE